MKLFDKIKQHIQWRLECKERRKQYKLALKKLKQESNPTKLNYKNPYWKKDWFPYIKYDHNFDWSYLYKLIMYKLKLMRINLDIYSSTTDEYRIPILKSLDECIEAGEYAYNNDYDKDVYDFARAHTTPVVYIYRKLNELLVKLECPRTQDNGFEDWFARNKEADKWVEEHGYNKNQVTYAYSSKWDDEANYEEWLKLTQTAEERRQQDWVKFFTLIAQYMREWWD